MAAKKIKKLAVLIDEAFDLRIQRKRLEGEVAKLKKQEEDIKALVITSFAKDEINGVRSERGMVSVTSKDVPQIDEEHGGWEAFYAYVKKTGSFELLQKRLGEGACGERWEAGQEIPGVKKFTKIEVKLSERK